MEVVCITGPVPVASATRRPMGARTPKITVRLVDPVIELPPVVAIVPSLPLAAEPDRRALPARLPGFRRALAAYEVSLEPSRVIAVG